MNILVLGSDGMAGSMISACLSKRYNVTSFNRKNFDALTDTIPDLTNYDYVINCIGLIKQRNVTDDSLFFKLNSEFPQKLVKSCNKLIHISSDCVFSGSLSEDKSYQTKDLTDATDSYGKSKADGEVIKTKAMVLRTSIIGPSKTNLGLFAWFKHSENPAGFENHLWSGITTLELANIIETCICSAQYKPGLYQIASEKISKYNLLCLINDIFSFNKNLSKHNDTLSINRSLVPDIQALNLKDQLFMLKTHMDNIIF